MAEVKRNVFNVAVVQMTPVFFDNQATMRKIESTLSDLNYRGCRLVVLPESLLPGYPRGFNFGASVGRRTEAGRRLWLEYHQNSVTPDDVVSKRLAEMSGDYKMHIAIGVTERDTISSTLYCSVFHYSRGMLVHIHRKVKPTGTERLIWGEGDGSTIQSITEGWGRVGSLICWENYIPEARMKLYKSGIECYLAPTADARDTWSSTMRHIACESRTYVLSSNQFFRKSDYDSSLHHLLEDDQPDILCQGGSCIVSPYGELVAGPLYGEEGNLVVEIDMSEVIKSRMDFDVIGHYRPATLVQD